MVMGEICLGSKWLLHVAEITQNIKTWVLVPCFIGTFVMSGTSVYCHRIYLTKNMTEDIFDMSNVRILKEIEKKIMGVFILFMSSVS